MKLGVKAVILGALAVFAASYWALRRPSTQIYVIETGGASSEETSREAVDFALADETGRLVRLSELRGNAVLLNFWASWCPPCVEELPSLVKLAEGASKMGITLVAVSVDEGWEPIRKLFREKKLWSNGPLPLKILLDRKGEVASKWGVSKFPETFFVNRDFRVVRRFIGPQEWISEEILSWLSAQLRS